MDKRIHVAIVGGGIGGLVLALALRRIGVRVAVYEQAPTLGDVGAGLTLASNGTRLLIDLGLQPVLDDLACQPPRGAIFHYRTGRTLVEIERGPAPTARYGAPYCQIHRADLHSALVAAVRSTDPECIHLGHGLVDIGQDADGVTAVFANGAARRSDLLVGCDGIRSTVRERLFGAESPRFTGYAAWRALVPTAALPADLIVPDSAMWMGPGRFLTRYKVRRGELVNYVACARTNHWSAEGWSVRSTVEQVRAAFESFHPAAQALLAATPADSLFKWGIFDRDPLPTWSVGRATLLGDAAHPTTPFLGQGAVMAMEDAVVLARALAESPSVQTALARYEAARIDRTSRVMRESRENGDRLTSLDPDRYGAAEHWNEESLDLASYDALTVPI